MGLPAVVAERKEDRPSIPELGPNRQVMIGAEQPCLSKANIAAVFSCSAPLYKI